MRWIRVALLAFILPAWSATGSTTADDPAAQPQTVAEIVSGVESTYRGVVSLRADFVQTTRSAALGTEDRQKGRIQLKRPRMMRMEFTGPDSKLVVTDGATIWIHSPADQQVFVYRDLGGGDSGMGVLLDDLDKLSEHFDVKIVDQADGAGSKSYVLDLSPREQASYKTLRVEVSRRKYTLERLVIIDQMDNMTELDFTQVKMNIEMPDTDFAFEAPKGTQVIEGM